MLPCSRSVGPGFEGNGVCARISGNFRLPIDRAAVSLLTIRKCVVSHSEIGGDKRISQHLSGSAVCKSTTQLSKDRSNKTSSSVVEPCWIGSKGHRRARGLPRYSALDWLTALIQWAGSRHPLRSLALGLWVYEPSRCSRGRRLPPWLAPLRANHIE